MFHQRGMQEKVYNIKDFALVWRLLGTLSRISVLTDFFMNIIFLIYLCYSIRLCLFYQTVLWIYSVKPTQLSRRHEWSTVEKLLIIPQLSLKTLKKHLLKTWFPWPVYIMFYFLRWLLLIYHLLRLPAGTIPSSNSLLISGTILLFTMKISTTSFWSISKFSQFAYMWHHSLHY